MTAFCSINNRLDSFLICISFIVVYGSQSYCWLAHDISQNWAHYVVIALGFGGGGVFYFILFLFYFASSVHFMPGEFST